MFYVLFVIFMAAATYYSLYRPLAQERLYLIFFGLLFFLVAFRFDVGCDWSGYYYQWQTIETNSASSSFAGRAPGWFLLVKSLQFLGLQYPALNIVTASIFFACLYKFNKTQPNQLAFLFFLLPVLIINMPMSAIRQAVAIGFLLLAMQSFVNRRTSIFIIWVIFASSFHASSIIMIFMAPFARGTFSSSRLAVAAIFAVPVLILIASSDASEVANSRYVNSGKEAYGAIFRVLFLALTGFVFLAFIRPIWAKRSPNDYNLLLLGSTGMIMLLPLLMLSSVIADRLSYYFIPFQAIIFARLIYLEHAGKIPVVTQFAFIATIGFFGIWAASSDHFANCYVPYQSWITGYPQPIEDSI